MKRREFITLFGGATVAWPLQVAARQPERIRRVGYVRVTKPTDSEFEAFKGALADKGYTEGRNLDLLPAWGGGNQSQFAEIAKSLVTGGVDVIAVDGDRAIRTLHKVSGEIPIVMIRSANPFVGGLISSLSRPGGHVTGFTTQAVDITGKIIEILKELVPGFSRIAMIIPSVTPSYVRSLFGGNQDKAARALGIDSIQVLLKNLDAPGDAMRQAVSENASGAIVRGTPLFSTEQRKRIVDAAAAHRLPVIYESRVYVEQGGLVAYAVDTEELHRRAADYVARILDGAVVGELPMQQPTKFELTINIKTARALGLTAPPSILLRADKVIE